MLVDGSCVVLLDDTDGSISVFESDTTLASEYSKVFEDSWKDAVSADVLAGMSQAEARQVMGIADVVRTTGLSYILGEHERQKQDSGGAGNGTASGDGLYGLLVRNELAPDPAKSTEQALDVFDAVMRVTRAGSVSVEPGGNSVVIESAHGGGVGGAGGALPWVMTIEGCLQRRGYTTRTARRASPSSRCKDAGTDVGRDNGGRDSNAGSGRGSETCTVERFHIRMDKN